MKTKDYKEKRKDIKKRKRALEGKKFNSVLERKKAKDDLKREYRALKRSEKNELKKIFKNL